jgi:hypothetical protein
MPESGRIALLAIGAIPMFARPEALQSSYGGVTSNKE